MLLIFMGLSRVEGWTKVALKSSYGNHSMGSCLLQTYLFEKLVTKIESSQNYVHQNGKFKLPGVITTEALPEASAVSKTS